MSKQIALLMPSGNNDFEPVGGVDSLIDDIRPAAAGEAQRRDRLHLDPQVEKDDAEQVGLRGIAGGGKHLLLGRRYVAALARA